MYIENFVFCIKVKKLHKSGFYVVIVNHNFSLLSSTLIKSIDTQESCRVPLEHNVTDLASNVYDLFHWNVVAISRLAVIR